VTRVPESQAHRDPLVEELVEELRDRVAFLERSLERRSVEAERYQQIVAGLTQTNNQFATRLRELEAPERPQRPEDAPEGAEPRSNTEATNAAQERPSSDEEPPRRRSWWREFFGF
jgi:hypothetical protein